MLIGDVIAGLEDEALADETLLAMGDLALAARVAGAAGEQGLSRGEFVAAAVGTFAAGCSDEEWLTVLGQMGRAADPGQVLLRRAIATVLQGDHKLSGCGGHAGADGGCHCGD